MKSMTRRQVLKRLAAAGACLAACPVSFASAAAPRVYKGVTYLTPSYRALMFGMRGFVDHLAEAAPPDMRVEFFDSGSLMKADAQVDALTVGSIQFMFHTTSYITKEFPILGLIGMPGVCEHLYLHGERLAMDSPLLRLMNRELKRSDLHMLTAGGGVIEPEYIWSANKPVTALEDLKGKRVRVVSHEATEMIKSFGGTPVRLPSKDIYLSLQRGALDAVVANISTIVGRNLHERLTHCYRMPVTAYSIGLFLLRSRWESMAGPDKQAFTEAARWYDQNSARTINQRIYPKDLWPRVTSSGLTVTMPTAEEKALFAEMARPIQQLWMERVGRETGQQAIELAMARA